MPSNLSADERAAVAHLKVMLANFAALAADTLNPAMRQVYERNATAIETVLAVVARAGEAVAWVVEFKRDDESEWRKSGPHLDYAEAERDQTRLLLRRWPAHIIPLYAHPADARDRGDASADTKRLDALERLVLADAASTGVGAVTIVRMPDDEHRDGHRITASWTVGMDAPPATTLCAAIDHAMHAAPAAPEDK